MNEDKDEQKEFETGPMSVLMHSVKQNTQVRVFFKSHQIKVIFLIHPGPHKL
jgi:hypothetical protein